MIKSIGQGLMDELRLEQKETLRSKILEIGCGTGKATVLFAKQGFQIDCVEPGTQLAHIAQANCAHWPEMHVHITEFENFNFEPKSCDLLFAAQAFHWVDPSIRMQRTFSALKQGGHLALIYNYSPKPKDRTLVDLSKLLAVESGGRLDDPWDCASDIRLWEDEIAGSRRFDNLSVSHFPWERTLTADAPSSHHDRSECVFAGIERQRIVLPQRCKRQQRVVLSTFCMACIRRRTSRQVTERFQRDSVSGRV